MPQLLPSSNSAQESLFKSRSYFISHFKPVVILNRDFFRAFGHFDFQSLEFVICDIRFSFKLNFSFIIISLFLFLSLSFSFSLKDTAKSIFIYIYIYLYLYLTQSLLTKSRNQHALVMEAQPHHMIFTPHTIDFSENFDTMALTNYIYTSYICIRKVVVP